jgi:hypothetical protein
MKTSLLDDVLSVSESTTMRLPAPAPEAKRSRHGVAWPLDEAAHC